MQKFEKRQKPSDVVDCFYLAEIIAKAIRFVVAASTLCLLISISKDPSGLWHIGVSFALWVTWVGGLPVLFVQLRALISAGSLINTWMWEEKMLFYSLREHLSPCGLVGHLAIIFF
jgi:hypothetical protein